MRLSRLGLFRRGGYQPPVGAWYAPLHMGPRKEHAVGLPRLGLLRRGRHRKHANISADYLLGRVDEPRPLNDEKKEGTL